MRIDFQKKSHFEKKKIDQIRIQVDFTKISSKIIK